MDCIARLNFNVLCLVQCKCITFALCTLLVQVLDSNQTVKQAVSTPPAKKMLLKSRKVKADCMQEEQEAAAAAVVVVGGEEEEGGRRGGGGGGGGDNGGVGGGGEKAGVVGQSQNQGVGLQNIASFSPAMSAAAGGVVAPAGMLHPFPHPHPHPHLTMEQSYAMVSATLHHHHHHHHHNLHHHDTQQAIVAAAATADPTTITPHPFPHLPHPSLDYSQLPALSTVVPYSAGISTSNAATTTVADTAQRQDYFSAGGSSGSGGGAGGSGGGGGGGGGLEGMQQSSGDYTTSPFSFIQNFLLPPVGVANLLDLTHASGAK